MRKGTDFSANSARMLRGKRYFMKMLGFWRAFFPRNKPTFALHPEAIFHAHIQRTGKPAQLLIRSSAAG
jgi:hypothetical protein